MGILYFAALLFWLSYLVIAMLLTGGLLWCATRIWRTAAPGASRAAPRIWRRCLAAAVAQAALGASGLGAAEPAGYSTEVGPDGEANEPRGVGTRGDAGARGAGMSAKGFGWDGW